MSDFCHCTYCFPYGFEISEPHLSVVNGDDFSTSRVVHSNDVLNLPSPDTMTIKAQLDAGLPLTEVNPVVTAPRSDVSEKYVSDLLSPDRSNHVKTTSKDSVTPDSSND